MKTEKLVPGSLLGGMLLVSGSCIGAGMLALPILTGLAGFFPSLLTMGVSWIFMMFTGLLLVEVNGWFFQQVNILSMAKEALGNTGRSIAWISYLFLFYTLMVAYTSASGTIFSAIFESFFHLKLPDWAASLFFTSIFGWIIYLGTRPVDLVNRILMGGLIIAYLGMIGAGLFRIHPDHLLHWAPKSLFASLPVIVVSFGFHNLIPSLTAYMKGDLVRVRWTIVGGSFITLMIYLLWSLLVLGVVPFDGQGGILNSYRQGQEATSALRIALGSHSISYFAQGFAFFAIVTSFLAQGLTLTHFLADGFGVIPTKEKTRWIVLLVLLPPLVLAISYPTIFFKALSFAGGICAMILFGILPVLMAWVGRYRKRLTSNYHVKGGKASLIAGLLFSFLVIACELIRIFAF